MSGVSFITLDPISLPEAVDSQGCGNLINNRRGKM